MAKRSKYESMPEPPCEQIRKEYKGCLAVRKQWRKWHGKTKQTPRFNVVGPYVEDDGRMMEGCIGQGLSRREAEELAKRKFLERQDYFVGYGPRLLQQIRDRTRVVPGGACEAPRRAEGFDLTWQGTPEEMWGGGRRRVPMLSGVKKRRR